MWIPDRPTTKSEILTVFKILENDWHGYQQDIQGRKETTLTAIILIAGFTAALCGEEVVRVDIGLVQKHWQEAVSCPEQAHIPLMLAGRFKNKVVKNCFVNR